MSYEFSVRAANRAKAKAAVATSLDEAFAGRRGSVDRTHAQTMANSFIDTLPDDETQDVFIHIAGEFDGRGAKVHARLVAKGYPAT